MAYNTFVSKILGLLASAGIDPATASFENDGGRYVAKADGITIIGNRICPKVTVRYNNCHQMMATI